MNSTANNNLEKFKEKYASFFLWVSPIGFFADLVTIISLFNYKQGLAAPTSSNPIPLNPQIIGGLALSDAVFLTGWLTALVIAIIIFGGVIYRENTKNFSLILSTFVSLLLIFIYFRLWLGENWWIFVCVVPLLILTIIGLDKVGGGISFSESGSMAPHETPAATDVMEEMRRNWNPQKDDHNFRILGSGKKSLKDSKSESTNKGFRQYPTSPTPLSRNMEEMRKNWNKKDNDDNGG